VRGRLRIGAAMAGNARETILPNRVSEDNTVYTQIRETTRRFAKDVIRPAAAELDRTESFPADIYRRMAETGLFGSPCLQSLGAQGSTPLPTPL
jgi:alkylation response protein AidB-like acyl-CoA dehydrogenase